MRRVESAHPTVQNQPAALAWRLHPLPRHHAKPLRRFPTHAFLITQGPSLSSSPAACPFLKSLVRFPPPPPLPSYHPASSHGVLLPGPSLMRREPHPPSNSSDTMHKSHSHEREMEKGRGSNDGNNNGNASETERMMLLRVCLVCVYVCICATLVKGSGYCMVY